MNPDSNVKILPEDRKRPDDFLGNQKMNSSTSLAKNNELRTCASIKGKAIAAIPVSYRLPDDLAIGTPKDRKNGSPSLQLTSRPRKVVHSETPEWLKNWDCSTRKRSNGQSDKFYYHKELGIMCRSLKEVERFEKEGIRPGRRRKENKKNSTNQGIEDMGADEKKREAKRRKTYVKKFLADAYYNQLHLFDPK